MPPRTEGRLEHREERFLDKEGEGTKKGQAGKEKGRDKREGEIKKRVRLWRGVCVCVCACVEETTYNILLLDRNQDCGLIHSQTSDHGLSWLSSEDTKLVASSSSQAT